MGGVFGMSLAVASVLAAAPVKVINATPAPSRPAGSEPKLPTAPPLPALPGIAGSFRSIAVMPLSSLGSTDEAARSIERVLLGELGKLLGPRLVAPAELAKRSGIALKLFEDCEGVVDCLIEVVGGLGWDAVVVGNIAGLGEGRVINLKMFDARTGEVLTRASQPASGEEKQLISHMRTAAVTIVAPELLVGTIDLVCKQSGVQILIDGQLAGTTPLANSRLSVPVGRRAIEASGEGLVPFSTFVEVAYEQTATVTIVLPENTVFVGGETPFRSRWWPWTIFGAGVIGAGLGVFFNVQQAANVSEIEKLHGEGRLVRPRSDELYSQEKANWERAVGFYIGGGTLVGLATAFFVVDLF